MLLFIYIRNRKEEDNMNEIKVKIKDLEEMIKNYGVEDRTTVIIEELLELAQAISKYKRYILNVEYYCKDKRHNKDEILANIHEEMADVLICLGLCKEYFDIDNDSLQEIIDKKMKRNISYMWTADRKGEK
jgi:NTP pyrophosphatase (non-canonical NTP hydrolase)